MNDTPSRFFVAYDDLRETPNIVVDGSANPATVLTLSHWPKSGTPKALKADSSAEIVFNYLAAPDFHVAAAAVTNNHFDEDGLAGLFTLIEPEAALAMRDLVVDFAQAGDFAVYRDRRAARVAFTVSAFANPQTSPFAPGLFALTYGERCAALYRELLPRLDEMLTETDRFRGYWEAEDAVLAQSERALADGTVTIEERPALDLAIVRIAEGRAPQNVHRFTAPGQAACHPMAVHNATRCNRILTQQGRRYGFAYRYESWVQFMTRPPLPRADLAPLAEALSTEETAGARWVAEPVSDLAPAMTLSGAAESAIPPEAFAAKVADFLATAPPAWDPYDAA